MTGNVRAKRIWSGIVSGAAGKAVSMVAPLLIMPQMYEYLGEHGFGVWSLAITITTVANFLDFGLNSAVLTSLSQAFGEKDNIKARAILSSAYFILIGVATASILMLLAVMLLGLNIDGLSDINNTPIASDLIAPAIIASFLLGLPLTITHRLFYAQQRVWISSAVNSIGAVLTIALTTLSIQKGYQAGVVVAVYGMAPVVVNGLATVTAIIFQPQIRPSIKFVNLGSAKNLLKSGSQFLLLSILSQAFLYTDPLLIGMKVGMRAVAEFNVPAKLSSLVTIVVTTLFLPLWAANANAFSQKDGEWIRKNALKMSILGATGVAFLGVLLTLFSNVIITTWMNTSYTNQSAIVATLCASSTLLAIASPYLMILNATGEIRVQIFSWSIMISAFVPLKYLFINSEKLWIAPLLTTVAYITVLIPTSIFASHRRLRNM